MSKPVPVRFQIGSKGFRKEGPVPLSAKPPARLPGWLHDILERHLEQELELPILPEAAAQVLTLCEDEKSDSRALERLIERDPSLASHVLRVANTAAYAPRSPIVSLQQAVSRLGRSAIRNIALAVSLQGRVFQVPGHQTRVRAIWLHSAVAASLAREVARRLRRNVEGAFLCGLLHDVGRPVVLQATLDALGPRAKEPLPAALLESAMDEFHEPVGARLVEAWKLADWTVAAVAHHHHPERAAPHEEDARVTRLADLLSHWALDEDSKPADFPADDPVIAALNLYPEDVEALLQLRTSALEFAEVLG